MQSRWSGLALAALWVLVWGVGGSLIDAGLIQARVYELEGGQGGTLITFVLWTLLWGAVGLRLWRRGAAAAGTEGGADDRKR